MKRDFLFYGAIFIMLVLVSWQLFQRYQEKTWENVARSYDVQVGMPKDQALTLMGSPDAKEVWEGLDSIYIYQSPLKVDENIKIFIDSLGQVKEVLYFDKW
ncbi:hypothetical protein [Echinicola pacifica]|nr:hypothetical protein [Echinicola pacifica]